MKHVFCSGFALEMDGYLNLLASAGRCTAKIQSSLTNLDKYLVKTSNDDKFLTADILSKWINCMNVSKTTKAGCLSNVKGFAKYLKSLGFHVECPELPKLDFDYVPYIFSNDELERIFAAADDFRNSRRATRSAILFPFLLRILSGCGLRLGEGLALRWKDVNLENGVITIREAKNLKERFVPISDSLVDTLKCLRKVTFQLDICKGYLFESNFNRNNHFKNNTFYEWFRAVLREAGVIYSKTNRRERGPCPHCLRHTFVHMSFLKSVREGRRFEDTAPFLAAYLGHDSPKGTEAYLRSSHSTYTDSHRRVNDAIGNLFPEVCFDED
jgi:integrase